MDLKSLFAGIHGASADGAPTGTHRNLWEIPQGYEGQVRARSGLAIKKGIGLVNGIGTIDSDYREN